MERLFDNVFVKIDLLFLENGFGYINLTEARENGFQQLVFVFYNDEESCIVTEKFDTSAEGGLRVDGQFIGVVQYDALENVAFVGENMGFREEFELFADEFDAFAVGTIDLHDIIVDIFFVFIDFINKVIHDGSFS